MRDSTWIVVPCYNEETRLDTVAFESAVSRAGSPVFLFVDDGSTDRTLAVLESMAARVGQRCRVLSLPENRGKAEAVRLGLSAALAEGAERVGYWDADLATPLDVIDDFGRELDDRPEIEVVIGSRVRLLGRDIHRSAFRHYVGRVYAMMASLTLGLAIYDTQCGAKLFRRTHALERSLREPFRSPWAFDVELLQRLQAGWRQPGDQQILEVPLLRWHDVGESKVSLRAGARAYLFLLGLALRRVLGLKPAATGVVDPADAAPEPAVAGSEERRPPHVPA